MNISETIKAEFEKQTREYEGKITALKAEHNALLQIVQELKEQIGDNLMPQAQWRKEYDALRARCREFANSP